MKSTWTTEEKEKVKEMLLEGHTIARIALTLGKHRGCVKSMIQRKGGRELFDPYAPDKRYIPKGNGSKAGGWVRSINEKLESIEMQIAIILDVLND